MDAAEATCLDDLECDWCLTGAASVMSDSTACAGHDRRTCASRADYYCCVTDSIPNPEEEDSLVLDEPCGVNGLFLEYLREWKRDELRAHFGRSAL